MIRYFKENVRIVEEALSSLDDCLYSKLLEDCLKTLRNGKKIVVSGLGKNVPVCEKFVASMASLGLDAAFIHTCEAFHGDLGVIKEGDVIIILSKSGGTPESLLLADKLQEKNIIQWAMTFEEEPNLSRKVDHALLLKLRHEGDPWNIMPMNSTIIELFVLQMLIVDLANCFGITLPVFKANHPGGGIGKELSLSEIY